MAQGDRSLVPEVISKLLLEENNEEELPDDITSDEEDIVEEDVVEDSDSAAENTDDTDADPDWDPNVLHNSGRKRRYLEICNEDLTDSSDDDPEPANMDPPVLSDPQYVEVELPASSELQPLNMDSQALAEPVQRQQPPLLPNPQPIERVLPTTFYGQNSSEYDHQQINAAPHNSSSTAICGTSSVPQEFEHPSNVPSTSSGRVIFRGRSRTRGRRPTRGRSSTPRNNRRGRSDTTEATEPAEPPITLLPTEQNRLILVPNVPVVRGKDRTPWSTSAPQRQNVPARNIVYVRPGPKNNAKNANSPRECFELFFTPQMISKIVTHTNQQILGVRDNYAEKTSTTAPVNNEEMYAFLGLLLFSAVMKNNHLSTKDMFDPKLCGSRYRAVMSRERFEFLCLTLRFDEKETRADRSKTDPLAPIRELWDLFAGNCRDNYKPGAYLTIDEQLLAFRGKCRFQMYIPNKPAKYGLKLVMGCDTSTNYMFNVIPYVGKKTITDNVPVAEYFVKEITRPVHGSNRNVTCDNWFTSIKLVDDLLKPPYNLTYIGTIRSNKKELPKEVKNVRDRPVGTSVFCFGNEKTLISYKPKSNKVVLLVSTMHSNAELNPETNKPSIIHTYNKTKGAVDTLDHMCQNVSCSRKTRRWPLCMFFGMQNITYINAYVIYCLNKHSKNEQPLNRRKFNLKLCDELVFPHMRNRLSKPNLQRNLRGLISDFLGVPINPVLRPPPGARKTCFYCPGSKRRMTTTFCNHCHQPICGEHRATCCVQCDDEK